MEGFDIDLPVADAAAELEKLWANALAAPALKTGLADAPMGCQLSMGPPISIWSDRRPVRLEGCAVLRNSYWQLKRAQFAGFLGKTWLYESSWLQIQLAEPGHVTSSFNLSRWVLLEICRPRLRTGAVPIGLAQKLRVVRHRQII